jgi:GT2 family glycosyltransferase
VLIVTYCNRATVDSCLASVRSSRGELAVTVVDNASPDGTGDHVARRHPGVKLIRNRLNVGFGVAVNQGARHGDGDYLLLVNPDTDLDALAIDQLLTLADRFPQAGLYGGRAVDEAGELDPTTCRGRPTSWRAMAFGTGLAAGLCIRLDSDSLRGWRRDDVRAVPVLTATFLLVDTQLWRQLGGFDEHFPLHGEDVDLCVRATGLGATPMFTPLARHRRRGSASSPPEGRSTWSTFPGH